MANNILDNLYKFEYQEQRILAFIPLKENSLLAAEEPQMNYAEEVTVINLLYSRRHEKHKRLMHTSCTSMRITC